MVNRKDSIWLTLTGFADVHNNVEWSYLNRENDEVPIKMSYLENKTKQTYFTLLEITLCV